MMNAAFPEIEKKVKSTDDPWIDDNIRKKIATRKRIYDKEDRSKNGRK